MFSRVIWFGSGMVSGAVGALWTQRKVRKAIRRQRQAAAQRVIAPPDSVRAALWDRSVRAQKRLQRFSTRYRPTERSYEDAT